MTATVTDCENEMLREQLEEMLHGFRENMNTLLQELTRIKMLEMQIERTHKSLTKKRAHLEETLIKISHSFDKLMRQV